MLETRSASDVDAVLEEIRARLGFTPLIYRELRSSPDLLAATWAGHRRALPDGAGAGHTSCCVALAVAAIHGCRYWVDFHTAMLRRAGVPETEIEAVLAAIRSASGAAALTHALGLAQATESALLAYLPHRGRPL